MTQSDAIVIKRVRGKGRGVFARRPIESGEVIETCPVLVLPSGSIEDFSAGIGAYVFEWGRGKLALALGYGSLYNHSYRPNARYVDLSERTKLFTACGISKRARRSRSTTTASRGTRRRSGSRSWNARAFRGREGWSMRTGERREWRNPTGLSVPVPPIPALPGSPPWPRGG